jgi:hypothetical protein
LICLSIFSCFVFFHNSSFSIICGQCILYIFRKQYSAEETLNNWRLGYPSCHVYWQLFSWSCFLLCNLCPS